MEYALNIGDRVPDFSSVDQHQNIVSSSALLGKYWILYFYPKDDTPGCTTEACSFRDEFPNLQQIGVRVIGVSPDSAMSHKRFIESHKLNFSLLPDENLNICQLFDVLRPKLSVDKGSLKVERTSFIIDWQGIIVWIERPVNVEGHVNRILQALNKLKC